MALGTPAFNSGGKSPSAPTFVDEIVVALDNSYPTGGYDFDIFTDGAALSLGSLRIPLAVSAVARLISTKAVNGTHVLHWNPNTKKLMAFSMATNAEVVNGTDLSTLEAQVVVLSK